MTVAARGRLVAAALLGCCVVGSACSSGGGGGPSPTPTAKGWVKVAPRGGQFSILAPSPPTETTRQVNIGLGPTTAHTITFSPPIQGFSYGVVYFDLPQAAATPTIARKLVHTYVQEVVGQIDGTVEKRHQGTVNGAPCEDVTIHESTGFDIERFCLAGKRMFQVSVATSAGFEQSPDVMRFIGSFRPAKPTA